MRLLGIWLYDILLNNKWPDLGLPHFCYLTKFGLYENQIFVI